jgi:hypothetical protein
MKTAKLRPIYKMGDMTVVIIAYIHSISALKNCRKTNKGKAIPLQALRVPGG